MLVPLVWGPHSEALSSSTLPLQYEENDLGLLFRLKVQSCLLSKYLAPLLKIMQSHVGFTSKRLIVLGIGLTLRELELD